MNHRPHGVIFSPQLLQNLIHIVSIGKLDRSTESVGKQ